jgi:predicted ATP-grasp superfamily ATP-dependent carboligase
MMNVTTVLITAVGAPPGLNCCRALAEYGGYRLVGTENDPFASGLYQHNIIPYLVPMAKDEEPYIDKLFEICRKESVHVIIPCLEEEVIVLSRHRKIFEKNNITILVPDYNTLINAADKYLVSHVARNAGVPCPHTRLLNEITPGELELPLVVKPRISHGARDIRYIHSEDELHHLMCREKPFDFVVQEMIPGGSGSVYAAGFLYDRQHTVKASFFSRSLKTLYPQGGPAIVGEPVHDEKLKEYGICLLDSLGSWTGPALIEFKKDMNSGELKLLEINPRLWGYAYLATACGINFPHLLVQMALGNKVMELHEYTMDKVLVRTTLDMVFERNDILCQKKLKASTLMESL